MLELTYQPKGGNEMKVSELVELLQGIPNQDSEVYVDDPDWGCWMLMT